MTEQASVTPIRDGHPDLSRARRTRWAWFGPEGARMTVLYSTLADANEAWTANAVLCVSLDGGRTWGAA